MAAAQEKQEETDGGKVEEKKEDKDKEQDKDKSEDEKDKEDKEEEKKDEDKKELEQEAAWRIYISGSYDANFDQTGQRWKCFTSVP